jgi:hypothetical protein
MQERGSEIQVQSLIHNQETENSNNTPDVFTKKKDLESIPSEEISTKSPSKQNDPITNPNSDNRFPSSKNTYPSPIAHFNTIERAMLDSQSICSGSKPKALNLSCNPSFKFEQPPINFETLSKNYPALSIGPIVNKDSKRFSKNYELDIAIGSLISTARGNITGYEALEDFINPGNTLLQNLKEINQENEKDKFHISQFKNEVFESRSTVSEANNILKNNETFGNINKE